MGECPLTTNAIECRNTGCKQKQPIPLKMTMINIYTLDEAVCYISGVSISHRDRSETARHSVAQTRQRQYLAKICPDDLNAQKGPPH